MLGVQVPPKLETAAGPQSPGTDAHVVRPRVHNPIRDHGIDLLDVEVDPGGVGQLLLPVARELVDLQVHELEEPLHLGVAAGQPASGAVAPRAVAGGLDREVERCPVLLSHLR